MTATTFDPRVEEERRLINPFDWEYHRLIAEIMSQGVPGDDRTGTGTTDLFGTMMKFDLSNGTVPAFTTKKVAAKTVIQELLWLISGNTSVAPLIEQGVHIWSEWPCRHWLRETKQPIPTQGDEAGWKNAVRRFEEEILGTPGFADQWGDMGPIYGKQWRKWSTSDGEIDQLAQAIQTIKTRPDDRRIIVEAWNVAELEAMAVAGLPPCHKTYQFRVQKGSLHLIMYQRSCDMFLGVPFNILSYAVLLCMVAQVTGLQRGTFTWMGGSSHVYHNHREQIALQASRDSRPPPLLILDPSINNIDNFRLEHINLEGYNPHPAIKGKVAV